MSKRMLVAVDLSEHSAGTLAYAYHIAEAMNLMIDGVHISETPASGRSLGHPSAREIVNDLARSQSQGAERELQRMLSGIPETRRGEARIAYGAPAAAIVKMADPERYEMLVVSTEGRTGFSQLFSGSVAESVVRHARLPVLVVR
ncbi:MAG: nucleotide-binding universal stress UspA family protein [Myxococcota bacterium]|jgi:nucleotide-binding universal stress UspA family protein